MSAANQRISNFKKPLRYKGRPEVWRYKLKEIEKFAEDIVSFILEGDLSLLLRQWGDVAIVPMPTSKPKGSELYDDRLVALCRRVANLADFISVEDAFDVREEMQPAHSGGTREVARIQRNLKFEGFGRTPGLVILIDDVLTTGAHFVACRNLIREHYDTVPLIGLFLARHRNDVP